MPPIQLTRPPSPEQLDRLLRVTPSFAWPALSLLCAVTLAGLVWSMIATVPIRVQSQGVLLTPAGVADIVAPSGGRLLRVLVAPGERVREGSLVAEIDQPELRNDIAKKRLQQAKLQERSRRIEDFLRGEAAAEARLTNMRSAGLHSRMDALKGLQATLGTLASGRIQLAEKGWETKDRVLSTQQEELQVETNRMQAENELAAITTEAQKERIRADREMLDVNMQIAEITRDLDWAENELVRLSQIKSPYDGMVAELALNPGENVSGGGLIMRVLPGASSQLVAVLYVPPKGGRAVQAGMRVEIIPSTAHVQRDGFIEGEVVSVSPIAATPEGMQGVLKNSTLVQQMTAEGAPTEATVRLDLDPQAVSGYRWSTGHGPDIRIGNGTLTAGRIVTERVRILSLVIPQIDRVLGRVGF